MQQTNLASINLEAKPLLVDNVEAAKILSVSPETLIKSRSSGLLMGIVAPPHVKLGTRSVRYKMSDLEGWVSSMQVH